MKFKHRPQIAPFLKGPLRYLTLAREEDICRVNRTDELQAMNWRIISIPRGTTRALLSKDLSLRNVAYYYISEI